MIKTLKGRLALWYTLLFALMALGVFAYIHTVLTHDLNSRIDEELIDDAKEIVLKFEGSGLQAAAEEIVLEVEGDDRQTVFYRIFSPELELLAVTDMDSWRQLGGPPEKLPVPGEFLLATLSVPGHEFEVRSIFHGMQGGYILQVGVEPVENGRLFRLFHETFTVAFIVMTLIGAVLGFLLSKRAMKGIDRLRDSFERVGQGDFSHPVATSREGIEIETLILTFNRMQHRILTLIEALRNVTNNIAHDLRSPLTRIRGMAETTLTGPQSLFDYQEMSGNIVEECDTLVGMINTMLEIAESDAGVIKILPVDVNITRMVQDVTDIFLPVAEDKGVGLSVDLSPDPLHIAGDKGRLQRALANLLDNALKYTPAGGKVTLSASSDGSHVFISVQDSGIGISGEDQKLIFDRFFRGDPSRTTPGNGLGLSLVKSIVQLHRGQIQVTSTLNQGSCFQLTLPVAFS